MRKFIINVNGNSYEVDVQEIKDEGGVSTPSTSQVSKPAPTPKIHASKKEEKKVEEKSIQVSAGQEVVKSPMPGNIWKVIASAGQEVKAGDVLLILEAMKMENEILAPRDGIVLTIAVNEGTSVNTGDELVIIE